MSKTYNWFKKKYIKNNDFSINKVTFEYWNHLRINIIWNEKQWNCLKYVITYKKTVIGSINKHLKNTYLSVQCLIKEFQLCNLIWTKFIILLYVCIWNLRDIKQHWLYHSSLQVTLWIPNENDLLDHPSDLPCYKDTMPC